MINVVFGFCLVYDIVSNNQGVCMKTANITSNNQITALPPQYQTQREIEAIMKDPRFLEKIGNNQYTIKKTDTGYLVDTDCGTLSIEVRYLPYERGYCGPAQFELSFGDLIEKDTYFNNWSY